MILFWGAAAYSGNETGMAEVSWMKKRKNRIKTALVLLVCIMAYAVLQPFAPCMIRAEEKSGSDTEIKPSELYARSAVLMDAQTGRILFAKNAQEEMPMASTTKIMTCILALEEGNMSDQVAVSQEAASQPEVKLGMQTGQKFYLKDLLYSLMLESHNDTAVAIAEHVGGSVQGFADKMNRKAKELGCTSTYFITPNGLDAQDENGIHHTTAEDLGRIMKYCIMDSAEKDRFLEITQTTSYTFSDCSGSGNYICNNHNTFLKMMDGALSGKTGFTADAGYCYVGALRRDDRTFIVVLLACGWPNNKGYKWSDTRKLMTYGIENYFYREATPELSENTVSVTNGFNGGFPQKEPVEARVKTGGSSRSFLMKESEKMERTEEFSEEITAPVKAGDQLGDIVYTVDGKILSVYPVFAAEDVEKRTFKVCLSYIVKMFLCR